MNMVIGLSVFIGVSVDISRDVFTLILLVLTVGEPVIINQANEKKIICRIILTMGEPFFRFFYLWIKLLDYYPLL